VLNAAEIYEESHLKRLWRLNMVTWGARWGQSRGEVTAPEPVRAEQVRRSEWKQNWTVPHCGSVLPICLSLRPVAWGSIHISCLAAREQTSAAQIVKASPPYNMKYFYSFLALSFDFIFDFFDWSGPVRVLVPSYRSPRHWARVLAHILIHFASFLFHCVMFSDALLYASAAEGGH